ncbi:unnamed protein product, partial [Arabidopsis halleri]
MVIKKKKNCQTLTEKKKGSSQPICFVKYKKKINIK